VQEKNDINADKVFIATLKFDFSSGLLL